MDESHHFHCTKSEIYTVATGAGMDTEMLQEFGDRRLAIQCPHQDGYLVLHLTKEQIRTVSRGKLEVITEEAAPLIRAQNVRDYVRQNPDEIKTQLMRVCLIPPIST